MYKVKERKKKFTNIHFQYMHFEILSEMEILWISLNVILLHGVW